MRQAIKVTKKQMVFYILVFLFGLVYQPNWVLDNFWLKADFYDDIPFQVPYLAFLIIYSNLNLIFVWYVVKFIKKYL
jgi:hypothetical protein